MDGGDFDHVTRRVVAQATRRAALVALRGGTLLLGDGGLSQATDRAQRGSRRKRNQRQKDKTSALFKRGISYILDNSQGTHTFTVEAGEAGHQARCCEGRALFHIPPGETRLFDTDADGAYAWLDDKLWIEIFNPFVGKPWVQAADGGMASGTPRCCKPNGEIDLPEFDLAEGESLSFAVGGYAFGVVRHGDKRDFKFFAITLPADL